MSYYFNLEELRREMSDARLFSRRFETMLTFKLNSLKELCGRLPRENEAFFIETKKSFTAFTFIVYLIKNVGHEFPKRTGTDSTSRCRRPLYRAQRLGRLTVQPHHTPGHAFIHE